MSWRSNIFVRLPMVVPTISIISYMPAQLAIVSKVITGLVMERGDSFFYFILDKITYWNIWRKQ